MKYYWLLVITSFIYGNAISQDIILTYRVTKSVLYNSADGFQKQLVNLNYDGYLFQKGNTTMYFEKPLYLDLYSSGEITIEESENETHTYGICMDTMQFICYRDYDSLLFRTRSMITGATGENRVSVFERGAQQWEILPDTMTIEGLHCQKAQRNNKMGQLAWVLWFSPEIETAPGITGTIRG